MAGTVTVAYKGPHGLILRLHKKVAKREAVMGGGVREFEMYEPDGREIKIKGYLRPNEPNQVTPAQPATFALTHGVDADMWEEWINQNGDHPAVTSGLLYAHEKTDQVQGHAKERAGQLNGLEPMNMAMIQKGDRKIAKDPRIPRATVPGAATPLDVTEGSTAPS